MSWIEHVKQYQKEHGCSYKEAMTGGKATYTKKAAAAPATAPIRKRKANNKVDNTQLYADVAKAGQILANQLNRRAKGQGLRAIARKMHGKGNDAV